MSCLLWTNHAKKERKKQTPNIQASELSGFILFPRSMNNLIIPKRSVSHYNVLIFFSFSISRIQFEFWMYGLNRLLIVVAVVQWLCSVFFDFCFFSYILWTCLNQYWWQRTSPIGSNQTKQFFILQIKISNWLMVKWLKSIILNLISIKYHFSIRRAPHSSDLWSVIGHIIWDFGFYVFSRWHNTKFSESIDLNAKLSIGLSFADVDVDVVFLLVQDSHNILLDWNSKQQQTLRYIRETKSRFLCIKLPFLLQKNKNVTAKTK